MVAFSGILFVVSVLIAFVWVQVSGHPSNHLRIFGFQKDLHTLQMGKDVFIAMKPLKTSSYHQRAHPSEDEIPPLASKDDFFKIFRFKRAPSAIEDEDRTVAAAGCRGWGKPLPIPPPCRSH